MCYWYLLFLLGLVSCSHVNRYRLNGNALLASKRSPQMIRYLPQHNFVPEFLTVKSVLRDF